MIKPRKMKHPETGKYYVIHVSSAIIAWYLITIPFCLVAVAMSAWYVGVATAFSYFLFIWAGLSPVAGVLDFYERGEPL